MTLLAQCIIGKYHQIMKKIKDVEINIAKDFGIYPGARYRSDGDFSGEEFYEDILKPKFEEVLSAGDSSLSINFDGTYGYASSFISEVFIRLVKDFKDKKLIKSKMELITTDDPFLERAIWQIINETQVT